MSFTHLVHAGRVLAAIAVALSVTPARAAVRPASIFTDNAVLQRGKIIPVWGEARDGEVVTVKLGKVQATTTTRGSSWRVNLPPMPAGGPHTLVIAGSNTVQFNNVLIGEVWIASGQSNMEWPLSATARSQEDIPVSADPQLRFFKVAHATSNTPLSSVTGSWTQCTSQTSPSYSAVAYYFARELRRALKVPVGVIQTAWGGTICEAWMSRPALQARESEWGLLERQEKAKRDYPGALLVHRARMVAYDSQAAQARAAGQQPPNAPRPPTNPEDPGNPNRPAVLYNAMIAPLIPYAIKGAIWYQGESNAGRAHQYHSLFPAMIRNWRSDWRQGKFPFYFVQLAPFMAITKEPGESAWAELREAQRQTSINLVNTGMAVITDVGEEADIHPRQKEPVGRRLAYLALNRDYVKRVPAEGPTFSSLQVKGSEARLSFGHLSGGLVVKGGSLLGFTIAGADGKWFNAEARVEKDRVVVSSPQVAQPVAVRYGWANFPVVNLWNKAGLPASPFRTDDFRLTTAPGR